MTAIPRDRPVQIDRDADGPGPIRSRTRSPHSSFGVHVVRREVAVVTVPPMRRPVEKQMDGFLTGHVGGLGQNGHTWLAKDGRVTAPQVPAAERSPGTS
jgi:hypothetical protein